MKKNLAWLEFYGKSSPGWALQLSFPVRVLQLELSGLNSPVWSSPAWTLRFEAPGLSSPALALRRSGWSLLRVCILKWLIIVNSRNWQNYWLLVILGLTDMQLRLPDLTARSCRLRVGNEYVCKIINSRWRTKKPSSVLFMDILEFTVSTIIVYL